MNTEDYFIRLMSEKHSPIGDDAAIVESMVYSKDIFFENVHFKRTWLSMYQIGYKAMIVNLSDAIAMNARPKYVLVGIAIPKDLSLFDLSELARGLKESAKAYGAQIIGGDTISNSKLDISITVVSKSEKPLWRKGLKIGDLIAHTGNIGESLRHLRYLSACGKVGVKSRFVQPKLRQTFVETARPYLRCGMDLSDGLYSDIGKLTSINRKGVKWLMPFAKKMGCSGEEYEMLFAFSPKNLNALKRISKRTRTPFKVVAKAVRGKYRNRCKAHHF